MNVTGTVGWMAPEVQHDCAQDTTYSRSADVFSLGLLYLALILHQIGDHLQPFTGNPFLETTPLPCVANIYTLVGSVYNNADLCEMSPIYTNLKVCTPHGPSSKLLRREN